MQGFRWAQAPRLFPRFAWENTQRAGESLHGWGLSGHLKARRNFGWVPPGQVVSRGAHVMNHARHLSPGRSSVLPCSFGRLAPRPSPWFSSSERRSCITKGPAHVTMWRQSWPNDCSNKLSDGAQVPHTFPRVRPGGNTQRAGESLHGWGFFGHLKARRNFGWVPPGRVVFGRGEEHGHPQQDATVVPPAASTASARPG